MNGLAINRAPPIFIIISISLWLVNEGGAKVFCLFFAFLLLSTGERRTMGPDLNL